MPALWRLFVGRPMPSVWRAQGQHGPASPRARIGELQFTTAPDLQKLAGWIHGTVYDGIGTESGLGSAIFSGCSSRTEAIRWNSCLTG